MWWQRFRMELCKYPPKPEIIIGLSAYIPLMFFLVFPCLPFVIKGVLLKFIVLAVLVLLWFVVTVAALLL